MTARDELLRTYLDAARAVGVDALSRLAPRQAVLVAAAMEAGGEICLVHATSTGTVIVALHPPGGSDADPVEIARLELCGTEATN